MPGKMRIAHKITIEALAFEFIHISLIRIDKK